MVTDSLKQQAALKHFAQEMRVKLREINTAQIHKTLPEIKRHEIVKFAEYVASIRSAYLSQAYHLIRHDDSPLLYLTEVVELKKLREIYDEAVFAYSKLIDAIEKGYIDIPDL